MKVETYAVGTTQFIEGFEDRVPEFDPRSGNHLWIMMSVFKVNIESMKEGLPALMDSKNLLTVQGPGCYYCEQVFTPLLATRRCKGQP